MLSMNVVEIKTLSAEELFACVGCAEGKGLAEWANLHPRGKTG
jgi:hypothetical protein